MAEKPTFEDPSDGTIPMVVNGKTYNARRPRSVEWPKLFSADYGTGFEQATFGEIFDLIHSAFHNVGESIGAEVLIRDLGYRHIIGNSVLLSSPNQVFIQDFPKVKNGRFVISPNDLESNLGSTEVKGVVYSGDRKIRMLPKEKMDSQEALSIFFTGDEYAPEKIANMERIAEAFMTRSRLLTRPIETGVFGAPYIRIPQKRYHFDGFSMDLEDVNSVATSLGIKR